MSDHGSIPEEAARRVSEQTAERIRRGMERADTWAIFTESEFGERGADGVYRRIANPWSRVVVRVPRSLFPIAQRGQAQPGYGVRLTSETLGRVFDGVIVGSDGNALHVGDVFAACVPLLEADDMRAEVLEGPYRPQQLTEALQSRGAGQ